MVSRENPEYAIGLVIKGQPNRILRIFWRIGESILRNLVQLF